MLSDEEFHQTVMHWALFYPTELPGVRHPCERISFHTNADGSLNLSDGEHLFHALQDPEGEAREWFASLDLKDCRVLFVYGIGLGYYYDAVKSWLREDLNHYVVFMEDDLEVIHRLLQTERGAAIVEDRQAWICYADPYGNLEHSLGVYFVLKPYAFSALSYYEKSRPQQYHKLRSMITFNLSTNIHVINEFSGSGRTFLSNFFHNLLKLPQSRWGNALFGKFKKVPAIICGAGPSLAKNIKQLEQLHDKALIFAGGTAMNALNSAGILPHLGTAVDPNPAQFTRLIMNQAFETPYFYRNRVVASALDLLQGEHLYITGSGGYEIARWFEEELGIQGVDIEEGFNVINFSVSIALALGCDPIIFVGVDLAYSNDQSYCPGIAHHALHRRRDDFRTKTSEEEVLNYNDIYGQPVLTLWKWIAESGWFSHCAASHPNTTFINATEGGIGFKGIPNISLAEVSQDFLQKQYDITGMLHSEIEQACMPSKVSEKSVIDSLNKMKQSLQRCESLLTAIAQHYTSTLQKIDNEESYPPQGLSEEGVKAVTDLESEIAYQHLLKSFSGINFMLHSLDYRRLKADERLLKKNEIDRKKFSINQANYNMLGRIATDNSALIDRILNESRKEIKHQPTPPSHITTKDEYSYTDGLLNIVDTDLGISISSAIHATASNINIGEGITATQYRHNGLLHGPSIYYNSEGNMLARCWYADGVRQGKASTYTQDGTLASIQSFKDGRREGLQHYFYPSGVVKATIPYSQGILNGEVTLYHPNGLRKRMLSFIQGKRHGTERLWNEQGRLIIEAHFNHNAPVGIARQWNDRGILIREVNLENGSLQETIREWDDNGILKELQATESHDYFDQVVIQTGQLVKSLQQMLDDVVTPLLKQAESLPGDKKEEVMPSIGVLDKLRNDLKQLNDMHKYLMVESGLDASDHREPTWKSASNRKELQRLLEQLAVPMQQQIKQLESLLVMTIATLKRKIAVASASPPLHSLPKPDHDK